MNRAVANRQEIVARKTANKSSYTKNDVENELSRLGRFCNLKDPKIGLNQHEYEYGLQSN
jgi:hypothetical protein